MTKKEKALEYFRNSFNCSQSVFTVFGTGRGLSEDTCLKVSCAFGGGMGRMQHTCGAVTGAMMVLGLLFGKGIDDPEDKKTITYALAKDLTDRFRALNGSTICRELLDGLDMNKPDELKKIQENRLFEIRCEKYVTDAISIIEKSIKEQNLK